MLVCIYYVLTKNTCQRNISLKFPLKLVSAVKPPQRYINNSIKVSRRLKVTTVAEASMTAGISFHILGEQ